MKIDNVAAPQQAAAGAQTDLAKLKKSAEDFEALLIGQMLKSARESGGSWFGTGEDEASSATAGFAEEQFARTIASQGGLGVASMLVTGLAADQARLNKKSTEV